MGSLYLLIPLLILLVAAAVWAFFWAVNHGQFEDLDEPARSILDDDPLPGAGTSQDRPAAGRPTR